MKLLLQHLSKKDDIYLRGRLTVSDLDVKISNMTRLTKNMGQKYVVTEVKFALNSEF